MIFSDLSPLIKYPIKQRKKKHQFQDRNCKNIVEIDVPLSPMIWCGLPLSLYSTSKYIGGIARAVRTRGRMAVTAQLQTTWWIHVAMCSSFFERGNFCRWCKKIKKIIIVSVDSVYDAYMDMIVVWCCILRIGCLQFACVIFVDYGFSFVHVTIRKYITTCKYVNIHI